MKTIDIEHLVGKNFNDDEILLFARNINTDTYVKPLLVKLIGTCEFKEIMFANKLLGSVFDKTQRIKYTIYAAEFSRNYAKKEHLEIIDNAINAAKNCLENDCEENKCLARKYANYAHAASYEADSYASAAYASAAYAADTASSLDLSYIYYSPARAVISAAEAASNAYGNEVYNNAMIKMINYGLTLLDENEND